MLPALLQHFDTLDDPRLARTRLQSLLRQMALNLLRQEKTCKNGSGVKRSKAGWDNAYLARVLDRCSQL